MHRLECVPLALISCPSADARTPAHPPLTLQASYLGKQSQELLADLTEKALCFSKGSLG